MSDAICITGAGVIGAGAAAFDPVAHFGKRVARAHDRLSLILMAAADRALADAALPTIDARRAHFADDEVGIVIGTFGSIGSARAFDLQALRDPARATATHFPNTVLCAAASFTAIHCALRESCVTLTNGETASLQSFALGVARLTHGGARQMLVGGVEEQDELRALFARAPPREGAAVFTLEHRADAHERGARVLAEVLGASSSFCPDAARAHAANVARLRASIGADDFAAIRHVFSAEAPEVDERAPLDQAVTLHAPSDRAGPTGSATGALAVAAMLADARVEPGAVVLVNGVSASGNATSVVFRKLRDRRDVDHRA
jgi:3-oxoacyl-(acyl-carrier-protein) synthase